MHLPIYLDYNSTTPCDPAVLTAMLPYFSERFGNAASHNHSFGWAAEEAVEIAREQVAQLINAAPAEILFTSGATESINLALKGAAEMYTVKGNHIITVATEHKAVLDTCQYLEKSGLSLTYLGVDETGMINLEQLNAAIRDDTILIAIMYANNETGVIQPIREIASIAKRHDVLFFTDATQAAGKIPVNVLEDGIDMLSLSAHKIYGPKGAGALYMRRKDPRVRLVPQLHGGGHEKGIRSGTVNVPGVIGLGKACEVCIANMKTERQRLEDLRNKLENALLQLEGTSVNGNRKSRLPHVSNIAFYFVDGKMLLGTITKNISVSSGSACTSALPEPSHVLKAMGVADAVAHSSLRFSIGRFTTDDEINYAVQEVMGAVQSLRKVPT